MSIQPQGEELRKAVKWIDEQLQFEDLSDLSGAIADACVKFDLSPMDAEYLEHFYQRRTP